MRWLIILLFLSTAVAAQSIADYPYFLFAERQFNAYIIKGDLRAPDEIIASNLVINDLPKMYAPRYRVYNGYNFYQIRADPKTVSGGVMLASEVVALDKPAIVIGTPCTNDWVRKIIKAEQCNVLSADQGYVALSVYENQLVVLVTGGSPEMVLKAAKWLHSDAHYRHFARIARLMEGTGAYQIGNGDLLSIGEPIGQMGAVVSVGGYVRGTGTGSYLTFPGGRVIFGERPRH
jgi:hypothetical protein